jgi:transposase
VTPDDPRHGTYAGYIAHAFSDRSPCGPCKAGNAAYKRRQRAQYYLRRTDTLKCSSVGSVRRVQALVALGHSLKDIAEATGLNASTVSNWLNRVGPTVLTETADRIADVYARRCMTVPQGWIAERARRKAERAGWAPPLAWDDIDDPNCLPTGVRATGPAEPVAYRDLDEVVVLRAMHCEDLRLTRAERFDLVRELHRQGLSDREISRRSGVHARQVLRDRQRLGLASNYGSKEVAS